MQNENSDTSGREQRTSLLLDAPVELVWEAWTKPKHIKHWWGPNGFTNTITKMEAETSGEWIFTMQGQMEKIILTERFSGKLSGIKKLCMSILSRILLPL